MCFGLVVWEFTTFKSGADRLFSHTLNPKTLYLLRVWRRQILLLCYNRPSLLVDFDGVGQRLRV